jgi:hypothetical protein
MCPRSWLRRHRPWSRCWARPGLAGVVPKTAGQGSRPTARAIRPAFSALVGRALPLPRPGARPPRRTDAGPRPQPPGGEPRPFPVDRNAQSATERSNARARPDRRRSDAAVADGRGLGRDADMSNRSPLDRSLSAVAAGVFATLAKMRRARGVHPHGIGFDGVLTLQAGPGLDLMPGLGPPRSVPAVLRLSRSFGFPRPLFDVLGVAVKLPDLHGPGRDQDFLLVSALDGRLSKYIPTPAARYSWRATHSGPPRASFDAGACPPRRERDRSRQSSWGLDSARRSAPSCAAPATERTSGTCSTSRRGGAAARALLLCGKRNRRSRVFCPRATTSHTLRRLGGRVGPR